MEESPNDPKIKAINESHPNSLRDSGIFNAINNSVRNSIITDQSSSILRPSGFGSTLLPEMAIIKEDDHEEAPSFAPTRQITQMMDQNSE